MWQNSNCDKTQRVNPLVHTTLLLALPTSWCFIMLPISSCCLLIPPDRFSIAKLSPPPFPSFVHRWSCLLFAFLTFFLYLCWILHCSSMCPGYKGQTFALNFPGSELELLYMLCIRRRLGGNTNVGMFSRNEIKHISSATKLSNNQTI